MYVQDSYNLTCIECFYITGTTWNFNILHIFWNDFSLCNAHFNYLMHPNTYLRVNLIVILVLKWDHDRQNKLKTKFCLCLLCDVIICISSLALQDVEINTSAHFLSILLSSESFVFVFALLFDAKLRQVIYILILIKAHITKFFNTYSSLCCMINNFFSIIFWYTFESF